MALQRAGIAATVYEAYPHGADSPGAFLTLAVNGLDALRILDLHRPVVGVGFSSRSIRFVSGTGKHLGELPIGGTLSDGTVTHTLRRADLHTVLYSEALRRGIRIEHGKRLVHAEPTTAGGVVARFEDGSSAAADLLIGADGLHSRTRRIIDPAAPEPRYTGLGNVGGFTQCPGVATPAGSYVMMFGRRAFFGFVSSPSGEIWWFTNPPSARPLTRAELAAMTSDQWKARLLELFTGDAGPAVDIIRSTPGVVIGTNQHDLPNVPTWYRGPMVIIGDAAHAVSPSSGQGASLAIEDSLVLAQCLRDVADPEQAFVAYERRRRPRVERIVAWGARMNSTKAPGPFARVLRDLVLPMILKQQGSRASRDWLFKYRIDWDTTIERAEAA
jgi:2-polyprenyl-6-methoxyphenol hydroxylase-like FAD-dependent oxidoreductase